MNSMVGSAPLNVQDNRTNDLQEGRLEMLFSIVSFKEVYFTKNFKVNGIVTGY